MKQLKPVRNKVRNKVSQEQICIGKRKKNVNLYHIYARLE